MLRISDLHVSYGGIKALRGINLEVPDGKIVTLIGANGAGKSTLLRSISGLVKPQSGSIRLDNKELIWSPINKICEEGIALSPEGRHVFSDLTVLENLMIGAYLRKDKDAILKDLEWIYELFPRLKDAVHKSVPGIRFHDDGLPVRVRRLKPVQKDGVVVDGRVPRVRQLPGHEIDQRHTEDHIDTDLVEPRLRLFVPLHHGLPSVYPAGCSFFTLKCRITLLHNALCMIYPSC